MMNNNKILTVSYGTFSCTLEGFDDSFGTMKAIAEYFRDLAADDRYFGAEPPQPDADMLARIAQKEISRRVEAREHEGKIVLSALADQAEDHPVASKVAPGAAAAALVSDLEEDAQHATEVQDVAPTGDVHEVGVQKVGVQDDMAITQDIPSEDASSEDIAAAQIEDEAPMEEPASVASEEPDAEAIAPVRVAGPVAPAEAPIAEAPTFAAAVEEEENDIVPGQPDAEVEAFFANSPSAIALDEDDQNAPADEVSADVAVPIEAATPKESDSIAAKLQRIRAVVAQHDEVEEADDFSEDEHANAKTAQVRAISDLAELPEASAPEDAVSETIAAEDVVSPQAVAEETLPEEIQENTVEEATSEGTASEDAADLMADARRDIQDALAADEATDADVAEAPAAGVKEEEDEDDIAAILARLDQAEADDLSTKDDGADSLMAETDTPAEDEDLLENLFDAKELEAEETTAADTARDDAEQDTIVDVAATAPRKPVLDASKELRIETEVSEVQPQDGSAPQAPRARVIKVKRADLEAAIKNGELEEYADEEPVKLDDLAPAKTSTSSLSPEDEDDLARELAELEADMKVEQAPAEAAPVTLAEEMPDVEMAVQAQTPEVSEVEVTETVEIIETVALDDVEVEAQAEVIAEAIIQPEAQETPVTEESRRRELPSIDAEQGADMSRLMAETDQQMDEPESATRRDAFAHLRAAVAAKKADDAMGTGADTVEGDDAYRNDLADVVRPRRPGRPGRPETRTARPGEGPAAPLKLVAEQRIDVARSTGPIRPRRVAAVADAPDLDGESFAEFAGEMGATSLPQLLEAAAAYMSFVEGREQFSRPQLMTKVRQAGPEEGFSREDGLRHFGQLLRAGKIEKIKGGRFTVSEDIGYHPDHRAAG